MIPLWSRVLFYRLTSLLLLYLLVIFLLYILLDFAAHGVRFLSDQELSLPQILLFYCKRFSLQLPFFASFAWLLSTFKVFFDLTSHRESLALQMAGLSKKRLTLPAFFLAFLLQAGLVANFEWGVPQSSLDATSFRRKYLKKREKKVPLYHVTLEDGSKLLYQHFDKDQNALFDVFWIQSPTHLWYMKWLSIRSFPPEGLFVDHFTKTPLLEKSESFSSLLLPQIGKAASHLQEKLLPHEIRPLSTLFAQSRLSSIDSPKNSTYLHYKLLLSLLPFWIALAIPPFAGTFSRLCPTFLLLFISLASFITLCTILDASLILAENQITSGPLLLWSIGCFAFIGIAPFYKKM